VPSQRKDHRHTEALHCTCTSKESHNYNGVWTLGSEVSQNEGLEMDRMLGDETAGHLSVYLPRTVLTIN